MPVEILQPADLKELENSMRQLGRLGDSQKDRTSDENTNLLCQPYNDHGNACRLILLFGDDLLYCHALKKWLVWDGTRWTVDETDQAKRFAKRTILEFCQQAIQNRAGEKAEKFGSSS